jgi:TonB family protein
VIGHWGFRLALPVLAMCSAPAWAGAQVISGELFDATGVSPLGGAVIRLALQTSAGESIVDSTVSDAKGRFRFERTSAGVYRLVVGRVQREYRDPQLDSLAIGDIAVRRINLPAAFADAAVSGPDGEADIDARLTGGVAVRYPPAAFTARKNGAVMVFVQVSAGGRVSREPAPEVRGTDPDFTREVEQRLSRLQFTPAQRQGTAIPQRVCLQFVFVRTPTPQRLPKVTSAPDLATTEAERALCARFIGQRITIAAG